MFRHLAALSRSGLAYRGVAKCPSPLLGSVRWTFRHAPRKPSALIASFDRDLQEKIIGEVTEKKFKMKNIENEVIYMESWDFPMPESFTDQQWQRLFSLDTRESRIRYIASIVKNKEEQEYKSIKEYEDSLQHGFEFTVEMFKEIVPELSPEKLTEQVLLLNQIYQSMLEMGEEVPTKFSDKWLRELALINYPNKIESTLKFLASKRLLKLRDLIKKEARRSKGEKIKAQVREERENESHIIYGPSFNTIFLRIYPTTMDNWQQWKVLRERYEWGQPLVFDLSFLSRMSFKNARSVINRELMYALKAVRMSREPFQVHFCNYNPACEKMSALERILPNMKNPNFYVNITEKSYMDLFPQEKLVYLSADSNVELTEFRHDDIYIIGALHDGGESNNRAQSLSRAKEQELRHARLPLKRFIGFSPELNVEAVTQIMSDMRNTNDWFYSARWVPARYFRRKLASFRALNSDIDSREEAYYHAHHQLSPASHEEYISMTPAEYRKRYTKIVSNAIAKSESERRNANPFAEMDQ